MLGALIPGLLVLVMPRTTKDPVTSTGDAVRIVTASGLISALPLLESLGSSFRREGLPWPRVKELDNVRGDIPDALSYRHRDLVVAGPESAKRALTPYSEGHRMNR